MQCQVCRSNRSIPFATVENRAYWRCLTCSATFLDARQLPDRDAEYRQYLQHENDPEDTGYRAFLDKLARPLIERLSPGSDGLDYGCGPGPALATMLREAGHHVALYDPFFAADFTVLNETYDFVACTEVVEHFHQPGREFAQLARLVRPGGWLGVMTCFQTDDTRFADWHYRRDPTHVVFYREETFRYLADCHGFSCEIPQKDVVLLQKMPANGRRRAPSA